MYYALNIYPQFEKSVAKQIDAIRNEYDPTAAVCTPHITVLFPTPARVGKTPLINHIGTVLSDFKPFEVQLSGFHKSDDHWLFLTLDKGRTEVRRMYQRLYSGVLSEFGRDHTKFIPHLGLGLFLKSGVNYNWNDPRDVDLDSNRFTEALRRARRLPLPE